MIRGKERRAHEAFIAALQIETENHALAAIEFLASELDELNTLFDKNNLPVEIKGHWVMQNMTYAVEMAINLKGREATLLRVLLTPLRLNDVQMVVEHGMYNGHDIARTHELYSDLDDAESVAELFKDVRDNIELAMPAQGQRTLKEIMIAPDALDLPEGHIATKYGEAVRNAKGEVTYDPMAAYRLALYYQPEQTGVGKFAVTPP